jgi:RibD C-terminal domain
VGHTTVMAEPVETAVPALKALAGSLFRLGLVDRVRVMVFPTIRGETGQEPIFADLPDLDLLLVLRDYRVAERPGDGRG